MRPLELQARQLHSDLQHVNLHRLQASLPVPFCERLAELHSFETNAFKALESVLRTQTLSNVTPNLHIVRNNDELHLRPPLVNEDGRINPDMLNQSFRNGFTLALSHIERCHEFYFSIYRVLIEHLAFTLNIAIKAGPKLNLYFTPPSSQALRLHWDSESILVLQLSGAKRWRIYEPIEVCPSKSRGGLRSGEFGDPIFDHVIEKGELLFVPPGYPHQAESTDSPSLHITFAYNRPTWIDFISMLLAGVDEARLPMSAVTPDQSLAKILRGYGEYDIQREVAEFYRGHIQAQAASGPIVF